MTNLLTKKRDAAMDREDGFTLIELMVVVLIIGILMAIAIPTFLSAKNGANAKAAQENVRNALTTEATYFSNNQTYTNIAISTSSAASLSVQEPNIPFGDWPAAGATWTANTVYVETTSNPATSNNGTTVALGALGKDNNCYFILSVQGQDSFSQAAATGAGNNICTLPASAATTWQTAWSGGTQASPSPTYTAMTSNG